MAAPRNYEELIARLAPAAVRMSGADHSSYRGYIDDLMVPEASTHARTDGVIDYTYETTTGLRGLVAGELEPRNVDALWEAARSHTMLLSPAGRDFPDVPAISFDPQNPDSHPAHPFTDAYADLHLRPYARELELGPDVERAAATHVVPRELLAPRTDGAHALAAYIAAQNGSAAGEVLRQIATETPGGCLREAARQLATAAGVPAEQNEPLPNGIHPDQVRDDLHRLLDKEFPSLKPSTAAPPGERVSLEQVLADLNNNPAGGPLPPYQPGWTAEGMLDRVKTAVGDWRQRLDGAPAGQANDDALRAVALGNANAQFGGVRPPAAGGQGQREGTQHGTPNPQPGMRRE